MHFEEFGSGVEPQRSAPLDFIGNWWKANVSIEFWGPDQGHLPGRTENLLRDRFNLSGHFRPGHEAPAARHEMIVATAANTLTSHSRNKKVYICLITALAMTVAASPLRAAEARGTDSPAPKALVVRADRRTGKLVRSVAPVKASSDAKALPSMNISEIVEKAAHDNHVDPLLVHSIIQVESNYNPYALSPKGAQGLMQLTPPTARNLGVSNSFDPRQNIEAGVRYLKYLQDLYKDDRLALAAYNAGPGAVEKYKWIPPYPETQDYVNRVGQQYGAAKKAAAQHLAAPVAPPVGVMEEKHPKLEPFVDAEGRLHLRTTQQ